MWLDLYSVENFKKDNFLKLNDSKFHKVTPLYFTDFWVLDDLKRGIFNFSCVLDLLLRFKSFFTLSNKFINGVGRVLFRTQCMNFASSYLYISWSFNTLNL